MPHTDSQLIVFDWDGTLMDSEARIVACMQGAIAELSLPERFTHEIKNIIGLGLFEAVKALYPGSGETTHHSLVDGYRHQYLVKDQTPSPMFEGAAAMLHDLSRQGYFLAVATGKGRRGLDESLDYSGVRELFHVTRCADETQSKPHPQMLLEVMDFVGVAANNTLMVGDTEYDIQMAHNARTRAVAVSYGVHEKKRLLDLKPFHCADSIPALHHWLMTQSKIDIGNGTT